MKNIDYEHAVIGALLTNSSLIDEIELTADDFKIESYQLIYQTILDTVASNQVADILTISSKLSKSNPGDNWLLFVGKAVKDCISPGNISSYAKLLKAESRNRKAKEICAEVLNKIDETEDSELIVDNAVTMLMGLSATRQNHESSISQALSKALDMVDAAMHNDGTVGISTGIEKLNEVLGGFHNSDLYVVGARPAIGKAQPLTSEILLSDGSWVKMGDIKLNDSLASVDGARSIVNGVFPQGKRDIYCIELSDGRLIEADNEHLWAVNSSRFKSKRILTTDQINQLLKKEKYKNRVRIVSHSGEFGSVNDIGVSPWFLGFMLGDGCLTSDGLSFSNPEKYIQERVAKVSYTSNCDFNLKIGKGNKHPVLQNMRKLGVMGKLSYEKFIPEIIFRCSSSIRKSVLAGLIESDGWVQNASVQFSSASEKLANDVIKLTRSLGGQGILSIKEKPVYAYKGGKRIGRPSYKVSIICPEIESIINSPRILKNLTKRRKSIEPIVRKITFLRSDYAQCISVTHDKSLYITNDYTMTHNTSVLLNFANSHTEQCGIISTEQPAEQIASRLISINGRVNSSRMRNGTLEEYDWTKITNSVHHLHVNNNIWINDKPGINILELIRQARKWKHQYDIKALYIDYIQRIKWTDLRLAKWEQVGNVVMSLKELGRDLDIPVIALAQVNRDVEKRGNARPNMGDLANSSEIEKEADVIMTLYRDEVYIKDSDQKGIMEINVCKNRHGPTGTAMVAWNEKCMRIDDLVPQTYQKNQANH